MSRPLGLLLALSLLALLAARAAAPPEAAAPPKVEVKTGLRVVATIFYTPATPGDKGHEEPAGGLPVKIFPQGGNKAIAEVKTDDKGVCVVALPAGKYRVEAVAFEDSPTRRDEESAGVEVKEGAVSEVKLKFRYNSR